MVVNGRYIKGRPGISHGHRFIFDTVYKNSHNQATITGIRFIRPDVALAHMDWDLKVTDGPSASDWHARNTQVWVKGTDGVWQVAAFHNTPIVSEAQPA